LQRCLGCCHRGEVAPPSISPWLLLLLLLLLLPLLLPLLVLPLLLLLLLLLLPLPTCLLVHCTFKVLF